MQLKVQNLDVIFDKETKKRGDRYTTTDGRRFTGVTSALSAISKPALVDWAARMAYEDVVAGADAKKCLEKKDYAHKRKSDEAKEKGTDIHALLENWDNISDPMILPIKEFFEKNNIKILAHEYPVFSVKYWFAGTFDAIVEWNGKRYILDWKTSSGIYGRDYFAQCSAYLKAFAETYPDKEQPEGYMVIRIDKNGKPFSEIINPQIKNNLSQFGNVYLVDNPVQISNDFKYFLSCLAVYKLGLVDYFDEEIEPILNQYLTK